MYIADAHCRSAAVSHMLFCLGTGYLPHTPRGSITSRVLIGARARNATPRTSPSSSPGTWQQNSRVVHATSETPGGKYQRKVFLINVGVGFGHLSAGFPALCHHTRVTWCSTSQLSQFRTHAYLDADWRFCNTMLCPIYAS